FLSCAPYSFSLPLPFGLAFDFDFAPAGELALLEDFGFVRTAALLCRVFVDGTTARADTAGSAPPFSLDKASAGCAPSGPKDRPRCNAVSCDSRTRPCRKTS